MTVIKTLYFYSPEGTISPHSRRQHNHIPQQWGGPYYGPMHSMKCRQPADPNVLP